MTDSRHVVVYGRDQIATVSAALRTAADRAGATLNEAGPPGAGEIPAGEALVRICEAFLDGGGDPEGAGDEADDHDGEYCRICGDPVKLPVLGEPLCSPDCEREHWGLDAGEAAPSELDGLARGRFTVADLAAVVERADTLYEVCHDQRIRSGRTTIKPLLGKLGLRDRLDGDAEGYGPRVALPEGVSRADFYAVVDESETVGDVADALDVDDGRARTLLSALGRYGDVREEIPRPGTSGGGRA